MYNLKNNLPARKLRSRINIFFFLTDDNSLEMSTNDSSLKMCIVRSHVYIFYFPPLCDNCLQILSLDSEIIVIETDKSRSFAMS